MDRARVTKPRTSQIGVLKIMVLVFYLYLHEGWTKIQKNIPRFEILSTGHPCPTRFLAGSREVDCRMMALSNHYPSEGSSVDEMQAQGPQNTNRTIFNNENCTDEEESSDLISPVVGLWFGASYIASHIHNRAPSLVYKCLCERSRRYIG